MRRGLVAAFLALCIPPAVAVEAGSRAPSLSLEALEGGAPVTIAGLRGQVVYVDFWASWCIPCRRSMPTLDEFYRKYKARGFTVVGVNKDATTAEATKFLTKVPVSFVLVRDASDAAARSFNVKGMPSGYLIDRKGTVRVVHVGFNADHAAALEKEIDSLLKEPS